MGKDEEKLIRDAILDYEQNRSSYYISYETGQLCHVERGHLSKSEVCEVIRESAINKDKKRLKDEEVEKIYESLKDDKYFNVSETGIEIEKVPLYYKLQQKYNIVVDNIKDTAPVIVQAAAAIVIAGGIIVGMGTVFAHGANERQVKIDNYLNSQLVTDNGEYNFQDIYVVYNTDDVHFCTREISKINEEDKIHGSFVHGSGNVDEYYYRDEIYDYFDIGTKDKVCKDHEEGFYIEKLSTLYNIKDMESREWKIGLDEITNDLDNDYLLSREPGLRRK